MTPSIYIYNHLFNVLHRCIISDRCEARFSRASLACFLRFIYMQCVYIYIRMKGILLRKPSNRQTDKRLHRACKLRLSVNNAGLIIKTELCIVIYFQFKKQKRTYGLPTVGRIDGNLKKWIGCSKLTYNLKTYEGTFVTRSYVGPIDGLLWNCEG